MTDRRGSDQQDAADWLSAQFETDPAEAGLVAPADPAPTQAMATSADPAPTQAMATSADPAPTQAMPVPAADSGLSSLFPVVLGESPAESPARPEPASPGLLPPAPPAPPEPTVTGSAPRAGRVDRQQRMLLWVAGGLAAALALVGLFALGTRLPGWLAPAPPAQAHVQASPGPDDTTAQSGGPAGQPAAGPVAAGEHDWAALQGGECLDPFVDAWQQSFTVVDCAQPHSAQLLVRGSVTDDADPAAYPGVEALQAQGNELCADRGVLDFDAAGQYDDIQVQVSHAASAEEWDAGHRDLFCFVSRSSGESLHHDLAVAG